MVPDRDMAKNPTMGKSLTYLEILLSHALPVPLEAMTT